MRFKKLTYILAFGSLLAGTAACSDDYFDRPGGPNANSNVVTYTPQVGRAAGDGSRAAEPEYQPVILTGENPADSLYLHTFAVNKIGYQPGESTTGVDSRGMQIEDVNTLSQFHKNMKVRAQFSDDDRAPEEYIPWSDARDISAGKDIWNTTKTHYWPSQERLAFHAVSPSAEFTNLEGLKWANNTMSFGYTAKKGNNDTDAEMQPDLLVATSECNKAEANSKFGGHAPLKFHHALSAIKFAIRDVANGTVENIKIIGVRSQGQCTYTADTDGKNGRFKWTATGTETYSQNFGFNFNQPYPVEKDIEMWASMPAKTFMLIPQQIPTDAIFEITLSRNRTGNPNAAPETVKLRGKIVNAQSPKEWKAGYEYVYTISTSNDNWVYVLEACGNHDFTPDYSAADGGHGLTTLDKSTAKHHNDFAHTPVWHPESKLIFVYAPMNKDFDLYEEHGHFHVRSFRYRVNKPDVMEKLPWKASYNDFDDIEGGKKDIQQYENNDGDQGFPGNLFVNRDLPHDEWIADKSVLEGPGSFDPAGEEKRFEFAPHSISSTWQGDKDMQLMPAYAGNSKEHPWDLSRMETASGAGPKNTANTYVIDRQGWYIFPCVYGNAITNSATNTSSYKRSALTISGFQMAAQYLTTFQDHLGIDISDPWIPEKAKYITNQSQAVIAWADVYNAISDISIITHNNKKYIRFYANQYNLIQGNVVIALLDDEYKEDGTGGKVVWSWQIWINEHWLDSDRTTDADGKSHVYADAHVTDFSTYHASPTGRRDRGDLRISIPDDTRYKYWISPVNLGWCDPKSQYYLRRLGFMHFVQYRPDGKTVTGKKDRLHMFQNGLREDYWYGNNTYYQFGRKEPMVGYKNHDSEEKRDFGKYKYRKEKGCVSLHMGIQRPNTLFVNLKSANDADFNDWIETGHNWVNLWNNTSHGAHRDQQNAGAFTCNGVKTVYDPCPPGYMVPPAAVWHIVGKDPNGSYANTGTAFSSLGSNYNGATYNSSAVDNEILYAYNINANGTGASKLTDDNKITLTSTGHRWYSSVHAIGLPAGSNFNPRIVYLWSSTPTGRSDRTAFGLALGLDGTIGEKWVIASQFWGRRSMARPIRPVRENYERPAGVKP